MVAVLEQQFIQKHRHLGGTISLTRYLWDMNRDGEQKLIAIIYIFLFGKGVSNPGANLPYRHSEITRRYYLYGFLD